MINKKPIFAISDLHIGDKGFRDNFAYSGNERRFLGFLDYVEDCGGEIVIVGDFFELWQANISKVLTSRMWLLDRLEKMNAIYVLGNHDADLCYFIGRSGWLSHPFFENMCKSYHTYRGSKLFEFIHGHIVGEVLVELCWRYEYYQFLYMLFTNTCLFFSDLISKNFFLYFPLRGDNLNL